MHKHTARSDYAKISHAAAALKATREQKLKREANAANTAERATKVGLKKLWSSTEEKRAATLRETADKAKKLTLSSVMAARKELDCRRKTRRVSNKKDLVTGYASVIGARNEAERVNLAEASIETLGKTAYQNSSLFSLVLQAMDFEKSMASKRATICRYALALGVLPSKLLKFIKDHGGYEKCLAAARVCEEMLSGSVEVGIIIRSEKDRHVLLSFKDKAIAIQLWAIFKKLSDDKKKHSRAAATRIINKIMKSYF